MSSEIYNSKSKELDHLNNTNLEGNINISLPRLFLNQLKSFHKNIKNTCVPVDSQIPSILLSIYGIKYFSESVKIKIK